MEDKDGIMIYKHLEAMVKPLETHAANYCAGTIPLPGSEPTATRMNSVRLLINVLEQRLGKVFDGKSVFEAAVNVVYVEQGYTSHGIRNPRQEMRINFKIHRKSPNNTQIFSDTLKEYSRENRVLCEMCNFWGVKRMNQPSVSVCGNCKFYVLPSDDTEADEAIRAYKSHAAQFACTPEMNASTQVGGTISMSYTLDTKIAFQYSSMVSMKSNAPGMIYI